MNIFIDHLNTFVENKAILFNTRNDNGYKIEIIFSNNRE